MKLLQCILLAAVMTSSMQAKRKKAGRSREFEWRDEHDWCDEARNEPVELLETCYADDNCCKESSQCANGCCGLDKICHKDCFSEDGKVNLHRAPITLRQYKEFVTREPCRELVYNKDDWEIDMYRAGMAWFLFLGFCTTCVTGCICFCCVRKADKRERILIYKA